MVKQWFLKELDAPLAWWVYPLLIYLGALGNLWKEGPTVQAGVEGLLISGAVLV